MTEAVGSPAMPDFVALMRNCFAQQIQISNTGQDENCWMRARALGATHFTQDPSRKHEFTFADRTESVRIESASLTRLYGN